MRPRAPLQRRQWLGRLGALAAAGALAGARAKVAQPAAAPQVALVFPRDAGAHTDFNTEWWYLTGWLGADGAGPAAGAAQAAYGFQITFFRSRVEGAQALQSHLAARQLLFAHAAVTDVAAKHLWHDQRVARWSGEAPGRNALDTASASTQDTGLVLTDWSLVREGPDLRARLGGDAFAMDLRFAATQPVLLQGQQGLSRKGPQPEETSYYYSLPQLHVRGSLSLQGRALSLGGGGTAWLDHEWSNAILPRGAVGWDWLGINLFDGSALTAFRLRDPQGQALWDGGSLRAGASMSPFSHGDVSFQPLRLWRSPLSGASYPVEWQVRTPASTYTVRALVDDQELDSRRSTGAVYWEGLCEVWDIQGRRVGRGYLEMTGYAAPLQL